MNRELQERIAAVAADRESGASEILGTVVAILRQAMAQQEDLERVASALRRAQPSMAPVWNATTAALNGDLERFAQRVARAPRAIARFASEILETGVPAVSPLRIVTISCSGTVAHVVETLAARRRVEVACSEGRPALEGRRLASRLAAAGVPVTCYLDAAIGVALDAADAVVFGADAIASEWFVNKNGTRMLATCAAHAGVPAYVVAGREKFSTPALASQLAMREGSPAEVWSEPPAGVSVTNAYFERTPLDLVAGVITDVGLLSGNAVAELCLSMD